MTTFAIAQDKAKQAAAFATVLAGNPDFTNAVNVAIVAAHDNKKSVNDIHFELQESVDDETLKDWVNRMPKVGSEEGKTGNRPFDKYEYKSTDGKTVKASYWRQVAAAFPVGASILKERDQVIANENLPKHDRDQRKSDLSGKFETFHSKLKIAVQGLEMLAEVREKLANVVKVEYATVYDLDDNGKVKKDANGTPLRKLDTSTPQIIKVVDATDASNAKYFTLANFVRLNVELTLAGEGTYGAFITSNKREKDSEDDDRKHVVIKNEKDFEDGTIAMLHYINGAKSDNAKFKALVAYYTAAGSDERLHTLADAHEAMTILLQHKALKDRVDAYTMSTNEREAA